MATRAISPKLPIATKITLFGGESVAGEFFVSAVSPRHPGPETLQELLNDNTRSFVPFQTEEGMMLLSRTAVRVVDFESAELLAIFTRPDNDCMYPFTVVLQSEQPEGMIEGYCYTGDLSTDAQRPVDLLNCPDMFLLVFRDERMILINKNAVSHVIV